MSKKSLESKLSVIIPYKELEALLTNAKKIDEIEKKYDRLEKRYAALHQLYFELLEKVVEIDKYL